MDSAERIEKLVNFYEHLTPESMARFGNYYSDDAYFKDPFNEVRGLVAIRRIFLHMFEQVAEPRFVVLEQVVDGNRAVLVWEFRYRSRMRGPAGTEVIRGVSHLRLDAEGMVNWHRDYWDAAEELYAKLPWIGWVFRRLARLLAS